MDIRLPEKENIRKEKFQIRAYEIDPSGKTTVQSICNYLQEIASNHTYELEVSVHTLFKQGLTWMLSRLCLQIEQYPKWSDQISIETWPSSMQGMYALRDFYILSQQKRIIAKATTSWMMIDLKKHRPVTMPDFIRNIELPNRRRAIDDKFKKLEILKKFDIKKEFNVRLSDLDVNQHVNYVNYIEWAVETIPLKIVHDYYLSQIEVSFRAESKFGDQIVSQTFQKESKSEYIFLHRLIRKSDNLELAIAKTKWTANQE